MSSVSEKNFHWKVASLSLLFLILGAALAYWQWQRGHKKDELNARIEHARHLPIAETPLLRSLLPYQHVRISQGTWLHKNSIFLDNQIHEGTAGYNLLTPLRLPNNTEIIMVNRGWLPASTPKTVLSELIARTPPLPIKGQLIPIRRRFTLSSQIVYDHIWQQLDKAMYYERTGLRVFNSMLLITPAQEGQEKTTTKLLKTVTAPQHFQSNHHYGYAWMWLILGIVAASMTLIHGRHQPSKH
jgi:surfeit locus 1 family protein